MIGDLFQIIILVFVVMCLILIVSLVISVSNQNQRDASERLWSRSIAVRHQLPLVIYNRTMAIAFNSATKAIGVFQRNGDGYLLSGEHVAAVEFKSEYMNFTSGTGETTTNRGSQLVGAGIGAAVAGPVGMLAGALSGSTQTQAHSSTQQVLTSAGLEIRFFSEELPVVAITTSMVDEARQLAARLAIIIDLRTNVPADLPAAQLVHTTMLNLEEAASLNKIAEPSAPEGIRRGWWQRTFGE